MSVVWRWPRRPAWLYPTDTVIRTRSGVFRSVSLCEYQDCRWHATWEYIKPDEKDERVYS